VHIPAQASFIDVVFIPKQTADVKIHGYHQQQEKGKGDGM
jgi:hypothetical protein